MSILAHFVHGHFATSKYRLKRKIDAETASHLQSGLARVAWGLRAQGEGLPDGWADRDQMPSITYCHHGSNGEMHVLAQL